MTIIVSIANEWLSEPSQLFFKPKFKPVYYKSFSRNMTTPQNKIIIVHTRVASEKESSRCMHAKVGRRLNGGGGEVRGWNVTDNCLRLQRMGPSQQKDMEGVQ